ncbi:MAG: hypothetical protein AAGB00_01800 [Planctomycetota bacterium]
MQDNRGPEERRERQQATTAERFFAGVTEHAFQSRLGVVDPPLVDYLTGMLLRFVRSDAVYGVRSVRGRRLTQVAEMLEEADERIGPARRRVHRHIGDFTLFWTGVYPEQAERLKKLGGKDSLLDYRDQGRRAYFVASRLPGAASAPAGELLERLAEQFELVEYGLSEVRRVWEERGDGDRALVI